MKTILLIVLLFAGTLTVKAQLEAPVKWSYGSKRLSATSAVVFIKASIDEGWHIYSQKATESGPVATTFTFAKSKTYTLAGKTAEPTPITKFEKVFGANVNYFENEVVFQQKITLRSASAVTVKGKLEFMTCDDKKCLPPDEVNFTIPVKAPGK